MAAPKAMKAALMASPEDTEAEFYEAMQQGDLDRLMAVWADDEEVACVHPGGPRVVGGAALRASFELLFSNGPVDTRAAQVRRVTSGSMAVHHVVESVRVATPEGPQTGYVLATNVYVKTPMGWRMLVHHASPGTPGAAQEVVEAPSVLH
jgi:ketosteroid isomerase-like protein